MSITSQSSDVQCCYTLLTSSLILCSGTDMKFTVETLDSHAKRYAEKAGSLSEKMSQEEAVKMLVEHDLSVYGDGRFPIEDYLRAICRTPTITFADYLQAVSMAMGDPIDAGVRENFLKLDKDRSGALDSAELGDLLDECTSVSQKREQVKELLECMDVDNDGKVNYAEIVKAICF
eukprot:sb/3471927/